MINALASELSTLMLTLQRQYFIENFTLSVNTTRTPLTPVLTELLNTLLTAVQDCNVRIDGIQKVPVATEWNQKLDEITVDNFGAPSPECLEALNLSVVPSPECLEAMNLSVAASPCYQPNDESHRDTLKTLHDVGTSSFWDNLENFGPENVTNTNLEFDAGSALGDGYMLDITSQVSVTDAINASIYFELDGQDAEPQKPNFQIPMDLSHPGNFIPDENQQSTPADPEKFQCSECGKILRTKKSLRRHQLAHGEGNLICDHCGKAFHAAWLLRRHVLAHVSGHVCEVCGKRCVDKRKLQRHKAIHSAGTFSCTSCRKCFSRPDGLKRHMDIVHHKSKDFICRICNKTFSVKCNLQSHLDSVHGQGESVQCDVCGKRCKNKGSFRIHLRIHGSPAKNCKICDRNFHHHVQYYRHMKNKHGIVEQ